MAMGRRITSGDEMLELALDVGEQARGAEAEQVRLEPTVAQLLLHKNEPLQGRLGAPHAAGRLEAGRVPGALTIVADHPGHDDADPQRRGHRSLACRLL